MPTSAAIKTQRRPIFFNPRLKLFGLIVEIPRHERQIGAAFGKLECGGGANALGASGDETVFLGEVHEKGKKLLDRINEILTELRRKFQSMIHK